MDEYKKIRFKRNTIYNDNKNIDEINKLFKKKNI